MWVEFVVGSRLCYEGFSPDQVLRFSSFPKNKPCKFQFDLKTVVEEPVCGYVPQHISE